MDGALSRLEGRSAELALGQHTLPEGGVALGVSASSTP